MRQIFDQADLGNVSQQVKEEKIAEFFNTFDADGNGKVELEEWLQFFADVFDKAFYAELERRQAGGDDQ